VSNAGSYSLEGYRRQAERYIKKEVAETLIQSVYHDSYLSAMDRC
jgi:hypothetical protein